MGSEDPVKLYYRLLLWREFDCIAYVGAVTSQCRQVLVRRQCNTTLLNLRCLLAERQRQQQVDSLAGVAHT